MQLAYPGTQALTLWNPRWKLNFNQEIHVPMDLQEGEFKTQTRTASWWTSLWMKVNYHRAL
eukprot:6902149-Ditylum_brightwellii.AAC.1